MNSSDDTIEAQILQGRSATAIHDELHLSLAMYCLPLRWRAPMKRFVMAVQQGTPLETAIGQHRTTLPRELWSILDASLQLPEPGRFVFHSIMARREKQRLLSRLRAIVAYPTTMLFFSLLLTCFLSLGLVPMLISLSDEFGISGVSRSAVRDQLSASFGLLGVLTWCALTWALIRWIGPPWTSLAIFGGLPYVGSVFRWVSLYEIVVRLDNAARQAVSGIVVSEPVAKSFTYSPQEMEAFHFDRRFASGEPLGAALANSPLSDGLCGPVLMSMDHSPSGEDPNLDGAAQLLLRLSEMRCNSLATAIPFLIFILIVSVLMSSFGVYMTALIGTLRFLTAF